MSTTSSATSWRGVTTSCCVGDGALRHPVEVPRASCVVNVAEQYLAVRRPLRLVQLAPLADAARRSGSNPWEIQPMAAAARRARSTGDARRRAGCPAERRRADGSPDRGECRASPGRGVEHVDWSHPCAVADLAGMRARDRTASRIHEAVDAGVFESEPAVFQSEPDMSRAGRGPPAWWPREGRVVGYAGVMFAVGDGHVTNIACARSNTPGRRHTAAWPKLVWVAIDRACEGAGPSRCARATSVPGAVPERSDSRRSACARSTTRTSRTRSVMWAHDLHPGEDRQYRARLARPLPTEAAARLTSRRVDTHPRHRDEL